MLTESTQTADQPYPSPNRFSIRFLKVMLTAYAITMSVGGSLILLGTSGRGTPQQITDRLTCGIPLLLCWLIPVIYRWIARKPARGLIGAFDFLDFCLVLAGVFVICTLI
jgi:hypothetical protein